MAHAESLVGCKPSNESNQFILSAAIMLRELLLEAARTPHCAHVGLASTDAVRRSQPNSFRLDVPKSRVLRATGRGEGRAANDEEL